LDLTFNTDLQDVKEPKVRTKIGSEERAKAAITRNRGFMEKQIEYYVAHVKHKVQRSFLLSVLLVVLYFGYSFISLGQSPRGFSSVALTFLLPANIATQGLILFYSMREAKKLPGFDEALANYKSDSETRTTMQASIKADRKPNTLLLNSSQRMIAILTGLAVGAATVWLIIG